MKNKLATLLIFILITIAIAFYFLSHIPTNQLEEIPESTNTTIPESTNTTIPESTIIKSPDTEIAKYKGIWLPFLREIRIAIEDIDSLKSDGVNIVAIGIKICWDGNFYVCEDENEIKNSINEFHKNGIKTFLILNPAHPDFIRFAENNEDLTLDQLTPLVLKWAATSETYDVEMFSFSNEPQLLVHEDSISVSRWAQKLLPQLREIYRGKLVFRIHEEPEGAGIYNVTGYDYIAFSGLSCMKNIDEYPEGTEDLIAKKLSYLKDNYPDIESLLFDIGAFTGPDYYWWEPIVPENMPETMPDEPVDLFVCSFDQQARFFEMLFNNTWNETSGYFLPVYKGWEYRNKPAEEVIKRWFNKN